MGEDELIEEYTRVEHSDGSARVQAGQVDWRGPHTPVLSWETVTVLPGSSTAEELYSAREALLKDRRYFRICCECSQLTPYGHMGGRACHGCMERVYGVVF